MIRRLPSVLFCLCVLQLAAHAQESMTKTMAGPNGDTFRILIAFMNMPDETSYKLQTFILDVDRVKKNEQPSFFYLDLTSTIRNTVTGAKKQKILVQQWHTSGDTTVKCDGGKWIKQSSTGELDKIKETVDAVVKVAPLDAKDTVEFKLSGDLSQKVTDLLNGLDTSKLQCVRDGGPN